MCAFFGPKNGDFQKMLIIVWNGEKCNKILKKLFLGGIVYWYWIVSFLVLNILGIVNKNNPIMLRSLVMAFTAKLYFLAKKMFKHSKIFNFFNCWLYVSFYTVTNSCQQNTLELSKSSLMPIAPNIYHFLHG